MEKRGHKKRNKKKDTKNERNNSKMERGPKFKNIQLTLEIMQQAY